MFRRILVALDQSPLAEQVTPVAQLLAGRLRSTVVLFHAVEPSAPAGAEAQAEAYLRGIGERFAAAGATVETVVRRAAPVQAIVECAAQEQADLLALCTHGHGGLQRWVFGSVTDKVLHGTRAPILLVRAQPSPPPPLTTLRRLMLTLDRSPAAEAALPAAAAVAKAFDAELLLYHVWDASGYTFDPTHDPAVEQVMRDTYAYSQTYLEDMTKRLTADGLRVQWLAESGNEADHILKAMDTREADLVVMSTHGRSGVGRSVLGSVADRVLRHGHKPLLLVRASGD